MEELYQALPEFIPTLMAVVLAIVAISVAHWLLLKRQSLNTERRLPRQLTFMAVLTVAVIGVILALPVENDTRSELLALLGLVLTGLIAFSSTTFVANIMAGLMLRSVKSFYPGDFVRVADHFGRVTERGLFHTEIQSEGRDLVTLPNLFLASNPVTVIRSSGTIVCCELSLGYDVPHYQVKPLLIRAVEESGLSDPFVHIQALGDFSITYRVCGFYEEVKHLLSKRSELNYHILDQLHGAGIEIVSPSFMNQRQVAGDVSFMAPPKPARLKESDADNNPESRIFDKAERAEKIEAFRKERAQLLEEIKVLKTGLDAVAADQRAHHLSEIEYRDQRIAKLQRIIEKASRRDSQ